MKKALGLILIFIALLVLNGLAMKVYQERNTDGYLAAGIDKENRLKESSAPRIILVGGSNVDFGLQAAVIGQETGIDAVNMGLQGSLGIRFQLNSIRPYLKSGDIVIISPEYENFTQGFTGGEILGEYLIANPQTIRYISSFDEIVGLVKDLPGLHTRAIDTFVESYLTDGCLLCTKPDPIYHRTAFNAQGDITVNAPNAQMPVAREVIAAGDYERNTERTIQVLNDFSAFALQNGIHVYMVFPSTSLIQDEATLDTVTGLEAKLRKELKMSILGSAAESQYEDRFMFNTAYHLNSEGALLRTQKLLSWLCSADPAIHCGN